MQGLHNFYEVKMQPTTLLLNQKKIDMAMESMDYEFLMTTIYNCDKHSRRGEVGADYYRQMEHAVNLCHAQKKALDNREPPVWNKSLDDLDYEAGVLIRKIGNRVSEALREAMRNTYDDTKRNQLSALSADLIEVTDKDKLDEVIDKAWKLVSPKNN